MADDFFKQTGITREDIIDTAMLLWFPHPGVETETRAREVFSSELRRALTDPNLWVLLHVGVALERDAQAGRIPKLDHAAYEDDLTCLIADEVLGMAVAMYISGYKAVSYTHLTLPTILRV